MTRNCSLNICENITLSVSSSWITTLHHSIANIPNSFFSIVLIIFYLAMQSTHVWSAFSCQNINYRDFCLFHLLITSPVARTRPETWWISRNYCYEMLAIEYQIHNNIILELLNLWKPNCTTSVYRKHIWENQWVHSNVIFTKIKPSVTCLVEKIYIIWEFL